jgi:hypothetical protein
MKNVIWIVFVVLALIWTALAFAASGLARWTSDTIEFARLAKVTQEFARKTEKITNSVTQTLTDTSGQVTERVTATVMQPVSEAAAGLAAAAATQVPLLPPLPEWVNQWLPHELMQSVKQVTQFAVQTARDVSTATSGVAAQAAQTTLNQATAAAVDTTAAAIAPWIASAADWLVVIVWVIWGVGLFIGLATTLIAHWLLGRFVGKAA